MMVPSMFPTEVCEFQIPIIRPRLVRGGGGGGREGGREGGRDEREGGKERGAKSKQEHEQYIIQYSSYTSFIAMLDLLVFSEPVSHDSHYPRPTCRLHVHITHTCTYRYSL